MFNALDSILINHIKLSLSGFILGSNVINVHVMISHVPSIFAHHKAFIYVRFFCSHISDCNICQGIAHMAVTAIVDMSITAHKINRLACISIPATTNHTNFFLMRSLHQSLFISIIDLIIIYKNTNHNV
ncbi:MAG: hypothetical protein WCG25_00575 [bacterium]